MVGVLFLACCCLMAPLFEQDPAATAETPALPQRTLHAIGQDISDAMRREAVAATDQQRAAAISHLCELFTEIRTDPRVGRNEPLQRYAVRVRSRLRRVKQDLENRFQASGIRSTNSSKPLTDSASPDSADADASGRFDVDDQTPEHSLESSGSPWSSIAARRLSDQFETAAALSGGPASWWSSASPGGAAGGGAIADFGPDLILLIQRTIHPDFWDVAGGPGTMYYYRPLMALVVRASDEVHGSVGSFVGDLRDAGN